MVVQSSICGKCGHSIRVDEDGLKIVCSDCGKKGCNLLWVAAFMKAKTEANRTGTTVKVEGFNDMKVAPDKDLIIDDV